VKAVGKRKRIFSTLTNEAICSSEMLVDTQWTTRRYIPEDVTLLINVSSRSPSRIYIYSHNQEKRKSSFDLKIIESLLDVQNNLEKNWLKYTRVLVTVLISAEFYFLLKFKTSNDPCYSACQLQRMDVKHMWFQLSLSRPTVVFDISYMV
jgi:hypothetical protein